MSRPAEHKELEDTPTGQWAAVVVESLIDEHHSQRGLQYPNEWEALAFANTELGEAYELLLAEAGGWVRNHPEAHEGWNEERFAEELGDVIMMVMMAGMAKGVNPLDALAKKLYRKIRETRREDETWADRRSRPSSRPRRTAT